MDLIFSRTKTLLHVLPAKEDYNYLIERTIAVTVKMVNTSTAISNAKTVSNRLLTASIAL